MDVAFVGLTLLFAALTWGLAIACAALERRS